MAKKLIPLKLESAYKVCPEEKYEGSKSLQLELYLQHTDNFHLVEEDERGERGQEVLLKNRRCGQDDVLDVLHPVCLMDLLTQLRVCDRDDLLKLCCLGQEFPVPFGLNQCRVVLKAAHHIHDTVVREHHLKEGRFIEEQHPPHNLIKVMQAFPVVQVLTYSEETQEFLDVTLTNQSQGKFFPTNRRGQDRGNQVSDLL